MISKGYKRRCLNSASPQPKTGAPLWRNRDYLLLWSGQAVSLIGTQVSQLAFPLLILALTHAPVQAGIAGALRALPYLFLRLPVGALVDRWNRKRVMLLCDSGRALALGSIPLAMALGQLTILHVYLVALIEGTLFVFFNLAEMSCLPCVVSPAQLPTDVARNETTTNIGYLLGPSLGGLLFGLGRMVPFLVDALSYLASVVSLRFIRTEFQGAHSPSSSSLWEDIRGSMPLPPASA
ncbi:MAG: MFS transporter [Ktedonobacterales bacterium]